MADSEQSTAQPDGFLGHPRGLMTLFFTELWERFSYYGMRAFLVFYIVAAKDKGGLGKSEATAGIIYAMYVSLVYLMSLPGGWLADRYLGQRKAVLIGGIIIMLGHLTLAIPGEASFLPGLAIIVLGTGLLKPNVSTIVGQLYGKEDIRRDAGYTIYYMGINVGAAIAPFICGYLANDDSFRAHLRHWGIDPNKAWHFGFASAAVGMAFGVAQFWLGSRKMGDAGLRPTRPAASASGVKLPPFALKVVVGTAALIAAFCAWRIGSAGANDATIADSFGVGLALIAVAVFWIMHREVAITDDERRRVRAMGVLFFGCLSFFGIFEQAGSTINLFTAHYVQPKLFFVKFDATWYQSINAGWILILGPIFAAMWIALAKARREPDSVTKFALGVLLSGLAFFVLLPTVSTIANDGRISGYWLVGFYFVSTLGELCLSPVGLSVMNKLAPVRLEGFVMGIWFLAISIGGYIAGRAGEEVGGLANRLQWGHPVTLVTEAKDHAITVSTTYPAGMFWLLILFTAIVAALLFAMAGPVKRMLAAGDLPAAKVVND
ncbi:MAG TPA: peptide MFS transporter [Kofleriaceae bacterium]|nr:peptide MFS transporter [Kofleriaceae bacterium]